MNFDAIAGEKHINKILRLFCLDYIQSDASEPFKRLWNF